MKLLLFLLILLFISSFAWAIYWQFIRPSILLKLRYRIFAARDQLRMMLIKHQLGDNEPAYRVVESMCNKRIHVLYEISLLDVILCKPTKGIELLVRRDMDLLNDADPALRKIAAEITNVIIGGCILNSPVLWPVFAAILLASVVSIKAKNRIDALKTSAVGRFYEDAVAA